MIIVGYTLNIGINRGTNKNIPNVWISLRHCVNSLVKPFPVEFSIVLKIGKHCLGGGVWGFTIKEYKEITLMCEEKVCNVPTILKDMHLSVPYLGWFHLSPGSLSLNRKYLSPVTWWRLGVYCSHCAVSVFQLCSRRFPSEGWWTVKTGEKVLSFSSKHNIKNLLTNEQWAWTKWGKQQTKGKAVVLNEWMNIINEWMNVWMNERINGSLNEWINQ